MTNNAMPWYVRTVVGIGAWITAIVLVFLGATFAFSLLELDDPIAISYFGAVYLVPGLLLLRMTGSGVFAEQLGLALSAAGASMIAGGIAAELENLWAGLFVAIALLGVVVAVTTDRILQFLVAALAAGFYVAALVDARTAHLADLVALATPVGLVLMLTPPRRDLMPTAVALLLTFPVLSILMLDIGVGLTRVEPAGDFARFLHIVLFLLLAWLHWRHLEEDVAQRQTLAFAAVATAVCLLLPAGGSAAMLLLMVAFVIGSRPFAIIGALLQTLFVIRYYYFLEMTLLNKSLLLMGAGAVLLVAWWLIHRADTRRRPA